MSPPKFTKEQLEYLEDKLVQRLSILSLEHKRMAKYLQRDYQKARSLIKRLRKLNGVDDEHILPGDKEHRDTGPKADPE